MKNLANIVLIIFTLSGSTARAEGTEQRALLAFLKVQPGTEQQFLDAAQNVIKESRREPGNVIYILHHSVTDPQQFVFYELFKTEKDLLDHKNSAHVVGFLKTVNPILVPNGFVLQQYIPE